MPEFTREFSVEAPLYWVHKFHADTSALKLLTPPPVIVQFHQIDELSNGATAKFTLWMGPIPIKWTAFHIDVSERGFSDIQLQGPFKSWKHQHQFTPLSEEKTLVRDHIIAEFSDKFPDNMTSRLMWLGLPFMFRYRQWRTIKTIQTNRKSQ